MTELIAERLPATAALALASLAFCVLLAIPLGMVNFDAVANAAWFAVPTPLKFGLKFNVAAIAGMTFFLIDTDGTEVFLLDAIRLSREPCPDSSAPSDPAPP